MESTTKTAAKAAKAAKKATTTKAEQTATKKAEQAATATEQTEQTVTTTEQMKGEEKNMKTAKTDAAKTAPKTETTATETTAEQKKGENENMNAEQMKNAADEQTATKTEDAAKIAAAIEQTEAAAIRAFIKTAKTAAKAEDRRRAAEQAAKGIEAFNLRSIHNAAARCNFLAAAEAYRPKEPKKAEARVKGYDYNRRADVVKYIVINEDGEENERIMNLVTFARTAFIKTANAEQAAAFFAAADAVEAYLKNYIEYDRDEGAKKAAAALTKLSTACGLDAFTTKTAADGKQYPFYVDRSFVKTAAAALKAKRGVYMTAFAASEQAFIAYENATEDRRTKAAVRYAKAQNAAVKAVFDIIASAAAAAVVGRYEAAVFTAADVKAAAAAKKAAAEAKEEERAAKAAKTAEQKRAKAAKLREQAAKLEKAADEQAKTEQAADVA